jgi:hypothetical protein
MSKDDDREQRLHQQPPEEDNDSEAISSPRVLPIYNGEDDHYDSGDESEETFDWGIPEQLLENDGFRTRIRQVQLQNYLMHCTVLQNIIRQLQHTPWVRETQHSMKWHYEKMCSLAYKACQIADMLESRDLKARCKYWAGRACAGIRDYQQAESYFKSALLHDVKNAKNENGDVQLRGLRPSEKADVHFLRDSCRARHADYEGRREKNRRLADRESWETGRPIEDCLNAQLPPSPPWVPDRDRVVKIGQHKYDDKEDIAEEVRRLLGEGLEEEAQAQWQKGDETVQNMHRRTLSREEWRYINRDIKVSKKDVAIQSAEPEQTSKSQSELHKHVLERRGAVSPGAPDLATSDSSPRYQHSFTGEGNARDMNGYSPALIARSRTSRSRTSSRPTPQNLAEPLAGAWDDSSSSGEYASNQVSPKVSPSVYSRPEQRSPAATEEPDTAKQVSSPFSSGICPSPDRYSPNITEAETSMTERLLEPTHDNSRSPHLEQNAEEL